LFYYSCTPSQKAARERQAQMIIITITHPTGKNGISFVTRTATLELQQGSYKKRQIGKDNTIHGAALTTNYKP
jgi:hypothetical protein